jgi:para-aminobenzoate synthetase
MRTLLIDNYDSFTFNLFQLIAAVAGEPPMVVRNDDWRAWKSLTCDALDAIIISPGPGTPTRAEDFGISAAALEQAVPLLGVCLGHQGLCAAEGALVARAPEPMHGRTSPVFHSGRGIFHRLPSPFNAVRYHSLLVRDLPPTLTVTATTPSVAGDIIMAVEHAAKPQWGVQFHPESILTEHGVQLLANFLELARDRRRRPGRRQSVTAQSEAEPPWPVDGAVEPERDGQPCAEPTQDLTLLVRQVPGSTAALVIPVIFEQMFAGRQPSFWLDSSAALAVDSRFSVIGGMGPLGEWVTAKAGQGTVTVTAADGSTSEVHDDMFGYLKAQLAARRLPPSDLPFGFSLGYVGYLGYEMKADCGGEKVYETDLPDAAFLFCDRAVVFDHETGTTWILSLSTAATRELSAAWVAEAEGAVRRPAGTATPPGKPEPLSSPALISPALSKTGPPVAIASRHSAERYAELVQECLEEIRAGESYEICLTNTFTLPTVVDPLETFRVLRGLSPVPYGAYLSFPGAAVLSASPERFLRITPDGQVQTKPIKGTRPRGRTPEEDAALAHDLATAEKDRAENLMIVDLLRNDLGRVAEVGSVTVPRFFAVESFATVHQLVSTVEARLGPGRSAVDCVRAAFPGGSMTGAPKHRTMQIIDRLEGGSRGVYSGALGYFSLTGAADLSIVIRTLVVYPDHVTIGAGGAVVALSNPRAEVEEMRVKARAPVSAVVAVAKGEAPDLSIVLADPAE